MKDAMNGRSIAHALRDMPGNAKVAFMDPTSGFEWRGVSSVEFHADDNVIEIHLIQKD